MEAFCAENTDNLWKGEYKCQQSFYYTVQCQLCFYFPLEKNKKKQKDVLTFLAWQAFTVRDDIVVVQPRWEDMKEEIYLECKKEMLSERTPVCKGSTE